ncbi:DUF1415 domain-containing protein [Cupriavidus plantarum]|uniref:Peptidase n=1 Tax=Cupriavidus plantarum TaxID=942865 RepID=A0A316EV55_9BURK|nr:DUF1415 domain-containing protein [Cupriavidus plantarum]PWK36677.1 hypothetical protein C7419_101538 [Cupriavidus plantarum]CAG2143743.1 hypothetical protein LMG26296_03473 [Cupriavidus plantarum]SMR65764.1 hypothetical protein SAMN05421735_0618 [Cupriavidus plantarum]
MSSHTPTPTDEHIVTETRHWLSRAVIGLNLCPFAKSVYVKDQVRYVVSRAADEGALVDDLERELRWLAEADPGQTDTTLLILPDVLQDFLAYNDFLYLANSLLQSLRLDGVLQIASFHPQYQFEGTGPDDIENFTNRSPWPILHLLREDSIERAVEAFPDAADIYERNEATMRKLGREGWDKWMAADDGGRGDQA